MIDERFVRTSERFEPPPDAFDRLIRFRERRRRVHRIESAVVALVSVAAVVIAWVAVAHDHRTPTPITTVTPPAGPTVRNGEIIVSTPTGLVAVDPVSASRRLLVGCPVSPRCTIFPEAWSGDGGRLLYTVVDFNHEQAPTNGEYVLDVATGTSTEVVDCRGGRSTCSGASLSPDGTRIASIDHWVLEVLDANGANAQTLYRNTGRSNVRFIRAPTWSPDGRRIAFLAQVFVGGEQVYEDRVFLIDPDGSRLRKLRKFRRLVQSIQWSPDGRYVALESRSHGWRIDLLDVATGEVRGLASGDGASAGFSFAPDGTSVAVVLSGHTDPGLYLVDPQGRTPPTRIGDGHGQPAWRPVPVTP